MTVVQRKGLANEKRPKAKLAGGYTLVEEWSTMVAELGMVWGLSLMLRMLTLY